MLPTVHARDVAAFRPASATIDHSPESVAIVGRSADFTFSSGVQEQSGTVLDLPVTVRFTPVAFLVDFGDGVPQRLPTTDDVAHGSFTYDSPGERTVSAAVEYQAHVNFGGAGTWRPVIGAVVSEPHQYSLMVVRVHTALVGRTCLTTPLAPGC